MALLDLGLVTKCFTTLLGERIPTFPDWPGLATLLVSGGPPDLVNGANALSFYLYHVREDAHTKSQDWQVSDPNPQRFKPMGLSLYYVLTPRSNTSDPHLRALADQLVMGLALKTLRDIARIDDSTVVDTLGGPVLVMPTAMRGRGNILRVSLQPTPPNEAVQYWQAGTGPTRLAAYYEVAATLLEPDVPTIRTGRVLMAGVHVLLRGTPRIDSIENVLEFTLPGESAPRQVTVSPASAPYGASVEIRGADLKGDSTALFLAHRDFPESVEADAAWSVSSDGTVMRATVAAAASGTPLLPGIYGAIVRTTARKILPDGSQRDFDAWSNQVGFAIAPAIVSVAGSPVLTITVDGFEPHLLADSELMLFVGRDRLTRVGATPPAPGEYFTPSSPAAARKTIRFRFPATATAGSVLPVRLVVRGAESGPWWQVVP